MLLLVLGKINIYWSIMQLNNLLKGIFVKRYKRFFIDFYFADNPQEILTAHCPNSGSMLGFLNEGVSIWVSKNTNPKNKLGYKVEIMEHNNQLVYINTIATNNLVYEALINKEIKELVEYNEVKKEVVFGESRFDFLLRNETKKCFVEVKSVTLLRNQLLAEFPDAKTERGSKHLLELIKAKNEGYEAYTLYIILRSDATSFEIAKDIDPQYYKNFLLAQKNGVNMLAYNCNITNDSINILKPVEIKII
jgi:sugar fermentation stimulation protein A